MIRFAAAVALSALAACGVDGPPIAPEPAAQPALDISISGQAEAGFAGGD